MRNYFKKFSIMFVMALAIIGIGMIQNGNTVNAATVGQQLAAAESGWTRYDDSDKRFEYKNGWSTANDPHWYNNTCHVNYTPNSKMIFRFYGSEIRVITERYTGRTTNGRISIDGSIEAFDNSGTPTSYYIEYEKKGLNLGVHTVEIYSTDRSQFVIDAIDIDNTGRLLDVNQSITIDKSIMNLNINDSQQLTTTPAGAQVTWTSSDSSIATVDSTGKVTGVKEGTCTITVTTTDGLTATCVVTVIPKGIDPNPNPTPDPTDTDKIVNIAHAKGTNTNNPGGEVTIIFHGSADTILSVIKTADVKDVWIGDNFTYTIVVTNTGTKTAKAVVVNDPAPNHIDFNVSGVTTTQGTVDSSSTSKNIIVNVGDILPGGTVTIKIPSTVIA